MFHEFWILIRLFRIEYFIGRLLSAEAAIEDYSVKRMFLKLGKIHEKHISSWIFSNF